MDSAVSHSCCTPARVEVEAQEPSHIGADRVTAVKNRRVHTIAQAVLPGGAFLMGDSNGDGRPADGELPLHPVVVDGFSIDITPVTNEDFKKFVQATGYRTEAETFGFSAVFHLVLKAEAKDVMGPAAGTPWWMGVRGADWSHPEGPLSAIEDRGDHPVVHVSWNDANAYCQWAGRRLPTEAEWEYAARGGLHAKRFPWGNHKPADKWPCNIWQGHFPVGNTLEDGWLTTAPVRSYKPNAYGLWQTVGNVWEWCADWYDPHYYAVSPRENPIGPGKGTVKAMRGGSYLCHDSYCNRYRNSARSSNTPDSSMGNAGLRTVSPTLPAQAPAPGPEN